MEILSHREKKLRESLDIMFAGLDDDVLKTVIFYTAKGASEEEKDKICEQLKQKQEEDLKYFSEKMEIRIDHTVPEEVVQQLMNPEAKVVEITDVVEETKSENMSEEDGET